jgi:UDP-glucose 4-epimerase
VNAGGTLGLLLAARAGGVRRFVLASSAAVYGDLPEEVKVETLAPAPVSPYGASKLAAEAYARAFTRTYGLETVSLRYFNVFGPRQDPTSQYAAVVPRFIEAIAAGSPVTVHGNGEQSRDFTYVGNVVSANLLAAEARDVSGTALNVGTGGSVTVNELASAVGRILERPVERVFMAEREGDVQHSWADISLAAARIGYEPAVPFEEGLRLTISSIVG